MAAGTPLPSPGASPAQRSEFATTDLAEAQAFLGRTYGIRLDEPSVTSWASPLIVSQLRVGGISYVDVSTPPSLTVRLDGTSDLSVVTVSAGTLLTDRGQGTERYQAGDVYLSSFPYGAGYLARCQQLRAEILTVPGAVLTQVAEAMPSASGPPPSPPPRPVAPAAREKWKHTAAFVRGLLDDPETAASPLIVGSAVQLLAATALTLFPGSLPPGPQLTGPGLVAPDTLLRAEEFIRTHAHERISLADLALAVRVTPRALQYVFAHHRGLSPLQYLRQVRLTRAHQDLLTADPASTTVTAVAYRWGFSGSSRFAAAYREVYGRSPSATLHA